MGIANPLETFAARNGPPKGPFAFLVSATRHGVTATKRLTSGAGVLFSALDPEVEELMFWFVQLVPPEELIQWFPARAELT